MGTPCPRAPPRLCPGRGRPRTHHPRVYFLSPESPFLFLTLSPLPSPYDVPALFLSLTLSHERASSRITNRGGRKRSLVHVIRPHTHGDMGALAVEQYKT